MENTTQQSCFPLISVIVPVFNGVDFLVDCLDSIFAQSYPNLEVIIVDDGSTDDSAKIIAQYPVNISLKQANQGPSTARNNGIKVSNGQFIAFLDADDTYPFDKLEKQYELLCKHQAVDLVRGLIQYRYEESSSIQLNEKYYDDQLKTKFGPNVGALLIRRRVFEQIGMFDENAPTCEDIDYWRRIIFHDINYLDQPNISLYYRIHHKNLILNSSKMRKGFIQFCKNEISRKGGKRA